MLLSKEMERDGMSTGIIERVAKLEMLTDQELDQRADGVLYGYSHKMITRKECQIFLDIVNIITNKREKDGTDNG